MDKRAGSLMEEFKDLVFPDGYVPGAKKRVHVGESMCIGMGWDWEFEGKQGWVSRSL